MIKPSIIKSLDEEARTVEVVASTEAVDAFGDVIEQDWDLSRFLANPIVLFGHDMKSMPIGHASDVMVTDGQLRMRVHFVDEKANPLAEQVFQSIKQGALRALSVGFKFARARKEKRGGKTVTVYSGNELTELSVVPVPVNPEAVMRGLEHDERKRPMKALLSRMGLADTATEDEALAKYEEIDVQLQEVTKALEAATGSTTIKGALGHLDGMNVRLKSYDAMAARLDKIEAERKGLELEQLVDGAIADGKLRPAQRAEYLQKGQEHGADFIKAVAGALPKQFLVKGDAAATAVIKRPLDGEEIEVTAELEAELAKMGKTPADYRRLAPKIKGMPRMTAGRFGGVDVGDVKAGGK